MDICGELRGVPHHQRYLIVAYDLYSKWPEAVSTGSVTTKAVIDFLEVFFARWGMPTTITTDNGPQFIHDRVLRYALILIGPMLVSGLSVCLSELK